MANSIKLYIGSTLIADVNQVATNRRLNEYLKSEQDMAYCDTFTFDVSWRKFQDIVSRRFDEPAETLLRVGKTHVVFETDGYIRFSGFLASRPARSGYGGVQMLSLKFFEHFARLSGDLVCDPQNKMSPFREFTNRPAHLFVQDLITEFLSRAKAAGETLPWRFGVVQTLAPKSATYKDFQTVSKALCDAMNNTEGAGKFDVVVRTDPNDHQKQIVDVLAPRGKDKNITIIYPSDGVYALWSTDYSTDETNEYASEVLVSGNGQVGDPATGENTAQLANAANNEFTANYCYWRVYDTQSNLSSQAAVQQYANKRLKALDFGLQTPKISLTGRPIAWGNDQDDNTGLCIGDTFYFLDDSKSGQDQSGRMRIIEMETTWDNTGTPTVVPVLMRVS